MILKNTKIQIALLGIIPLLGFFLNANLVSAQLFTSSNVSVFINADETDIGYKDETVIHWSSENATSCTASGGTNDWAGVISVAGSFYTGQLTSTETFKISCSNSEDSESDSVTISVDRNSSNENINVDISADDRSIDDGDSTIVRWDSDNADDCRASGGANGWSGDRNTSGSFRTGALYSDKTFRITCTNDDGDEESDSVTINVDDNNNSGNIRVNISADRTDVGYSGSTYIRWDSDNADDCRASGGANGWSGWRNESGSFFTGSLASTTTFRIVCENFDNDSESDSITIYVNRNYDQYNNQYYNYGYQDFSNAPTAVTTGAINVGSGNAEINSLIFSSGINTDAWFEWGPTVNLGYTTNTSSIGKSTSSVRSETISGLIPGRIYFYRAVAENIYGRNYGNTLSFTTIGQMAPVYTPAPVYTAPKPATTAVTSVSSAQSLVTLGIDGGKDTIAPSEKHDYRVTWENKGNQTLEKVVLRIILPKSMTFENANVGSFSEADNTLSLDIDTLSPKENGSLYFSVSASHSIKEGELLVVVANIVYTDASGAGGDALAYATHHGVLAGGSLLGANLLGSGTFLPTTLFGWLFLVVLILVLVLLIRNIFHKPTTEHPEPSTH